MSDQQTQITVDGEQVTPEEFEQIKESVNSDPTKRLKEVSPGVYKILERLND